MNIKSQNGAITLFATLAMLFFLAFMLGAYQIASRRNTAQIEEIKQVEEIYNSGQSADDIYEEMYTSIEDTIESAATG